MKQLPCCLCVLLFTCFNQLQANDSTRLRLRLSDFYVQNGFIRQPRPYKYTPDFKNVAPESIILSENLSDYEKESGNKGYIGGYHNVMTIQLGFDLSRDYTYPSDHRHEIRLGLSYLSATGFDAYTRKTYKKRFDTMYYIPNRQVYYDSVRQEAFSLKCLSDQLQLDLSYIFRVGADHHRWNAYIGAGLNAGLSINSRIYIHHSTTYYITRNDLNYKDLTLLSKNENEILRGPNFYTARAYVPIGIDFRIGKHVSFWNGIHIYLETRPGFNMMLIPRFTTFSNLYLQTSLGLRIKLNQRTR